MRLGFICIRQFCLEKSGQDDSVVVDGAVGEKPTTFPPNLLVTLSTESQGTKIGKRYGAAQLIIGFTAPDGALCVAALITAGPSRTSSK